MIGKQIVLLFSIIVVILTLPGCFKEMNENKVNGCRIVKEKNNTTIVLEEKLLGLEIFFDGVVSEKDITVSDSILKIVKYNNNQTRLLIAGDLEKGTKIAEISRSTKILSVYSVSQIVEGREIKRVGETLLGDFDQSGTVDLSDFQSFAQSYGTYKSLHDIAPSSYGTGMWGDIFSLATPDGSVDLNDFIVFAKNYGKKTPVIIPGIQPTIIPGDFDINQQLFPDAISVINMPKPDMPIYGIYSWGYEYGIFKDKIDEIGWKSIRIGGPLTDLDMRNLSEHNMEVMYTATMVSRDGYAGDQEFIDAYVASLINLIKRYGPNGTFFTDNPSVNYKPIIYWEIYNEPNFQYMWSTATNAQKNALYAKLLSQTAVAIRAISSKIKIVGFGAGGASCGDIQLISGVLDADANIGNSFDIASTHPYSNIEPPDVDKNNTWGHSSPAISMNSNLKNFTQHGLTAKPWWFTEVGYRITKEEGGRYTMTGVTQRLQAAYLCRMYALAMRMGAQRVHNMFITDTDGYNGGFFNNDTTKTWRESAKAVQNMIRIMPKPKLNEVIKDGGDGIYIYKFTGDVDKNTNPNVIMAWSVKTTSVIKIPCETGIYTVTNMLGNQTQVNADSQGISVEVGPCPIYIYK